MYIKAVVVHTVTRSKCVLDTQNGEHVWLKCTRLLNVLTEKSDSLYRLPTEVEPQTGNWVFSIDPIICDRRIPVVCRHADSDLRQVHRHDARHVQTAFPGTFEEAFAQYIQLFGKEEEMYYEIINL